MIAKAGTVINTTHLMDTLPVVWELLLDEDQQLVSSAGRLQNRQLLKAKKSHVMAGLEHGCHQNRDKDVTTGTWGHVFGDAILASQGVPASPHPQTFVPKSLSPFLVTALQHSSIA